MYTLSTQMCVERGSKQIHAYPDLKSPSYRPNGSRVGIGSRMQLRLRRRTAIPTLRSREARRCQSIPMSSHLSFLTRFVSSLS